MLTAGCVAARSAASADASKVKLTDWLLPAAIVRFWAAVDALASRSCAEAVNAHAAFARQTSCTVTVVSVAVGMPVPSTATPVIDGAGTRWPHVAAASVRADGWLVPTLRPSSIASVVTDPPGPGL